MSHKLALIVSRIIMLASTLSFLLADSMLMLIVGTALMAAGFAFGKGIGSVFMHETLAEMGKENKFTEVMGKISSVGFAVPAVIAVFVPFLVLLDERGPFWFGLFLDAIGMLAVLALVVPKNQHEEVASSGEMSLKSAVKEGVNLRFFRRMLIAAVLTGFIISMSPFRSAYQAVLELPIIYFGLFFGAGRLMASGLLIYNGRIKSYFTHESFYVFQICLFTAFLALLGVVENPYAVATVFMLMNAAFWGFSEISNGFLMTIIKKSRYKSTLLGIRAQVEHITSILFGLCFGYMVNQMGYVDSYSWFAVTCFVMLMTMYFAFMHKKSPQ